MMRKHDTQHMDMDMVRETLISIKLAAGAGI